MAEPTKPMGAARTLRNLLSDLMKARMQQGKTLTETAAATRVTRQSLTAWEEGKTFPTLPNLFLWARFLGKTIVVQELPPNTPPEPEPKIILEFEGERLELTDKEPTP